MNVLDAVYTLFHFNPHQSLGYMLGSQCTDWGADLESCPRWRSCEVLPGSGPRSLTPEPVFLPGYLAREKARPKEWKGWCSMVVSHGPVQ